MILLYIFGAVFAAIFSGWMLMMRSSKSEKATLKRAQSFIAKEEAEARTQSLLISNDSAKERGSHSARIGERLVQHIELLIQQAAVSFSIPMFSGLAAAGAVAGAVFGWMVAPLLAMECTFAIAGMFLPYLYLLTKRRSRLVDFDKALPDTMNLISRAVRAGNSVQAAFEIAGRDSQDPVRTEFAVLSGQIQFGLPQTDALLQMSERIPTPDLRFLVTALLVQRSSGGNLPEILDRVTNMIRERIRINGELRVKTAQGRLSGIILMSLPFVLGIGMKIMNPTWLDPLFNDPIGHLLLYYSAVSLTIGSVMIYLITKPEV
jgi:tight adherence protein B